MTRLERLVGAIRSRGTAPCLHVDGTWHAYADLVAALDRWRSRLEASGPRAGEVVGLQACYSLESLAFLLAAWQRRLVVALIPPAPEPADRRLDDARAVGCFVISGADVQWLPRRAGSAAAPPLLEALRARDVAGLVIFTSGTSGEPKAALHDVDRFMGKYDRPGRALRTLALLQFDHVAGVDTLLYTLSAGGALVVPPRPDPREVCATIAAARAEVLSASPSFLRLLWASGAAAEADLSSLRIITFGSEPMDAATLRRTAALFPGVRLSQKYGTTETGSPRTIPRGDDGLWIRLDQPGVEVEVRDRVLWIRSDGAFLGYLNAEAALDSDGWYCTGDLVEQDGPWLRILGRRGTLINVGGEKVAPEHVETVILELEGVVAAVVRGQPHPLLGEIVTAQVELAPGVDPAGLDARVRRHCRERLARHEVPVIVDVAAAGALVNDRQKTVRRPP